MKGKEERQRKSSGPPLSKFPFYMVLEMVCPALSSIEQTLSRLKLECLCQVSCWQRVNVSILNFLLKATPLGTPRDFLRAQRP